MKSKYFQFISGRIGQMKRIEAACKGVENIIWVHSSSYGEFEEARPVIAAIRAKHPQYRFLATFFSPSGYEYLKDDPIADYVFYLPLDLPGNASRFLDAVRPVKVIVSISDYWLGFLRELRRRGIPVFLISARFVQKMVYFKPVGRPYLNAFKKCFTKIIVNSESSYKVLESNGLTNIALAGDPRMDRVKAIAAEPWSDPVVDEWCGGSKVFVAGSTLPDEDDECIIAAANANPEDKFLVIPHEQGKSQLMHLQNAVKGRTALYTQAGADVSAAQVLIVDTVGMLSRLYRYGFAAFVGSGFGGGSPHSVIEPAAYGIPVSFGPIFGVQLHCGKMVAAGAAKAVAGREEFCDWYRCLKENPDYCRAMGEAAARYCAGASGVADAIAEMIMD
ncbi:MAG: 3-deoxy-D-manno-octulosonic acid transferase [Bacteroidales bacterium]|nr:3-deoxy-D-manno-octulosonic acid transferase [Bacteroidales bacterium]